MCFIVQSFRKVRLLMVSQSATWCKRRLIVWLGPSTKVPHTKWRFYWKWRCDYFSLVFYHFSLDLHLHIIFQNLGKFIDTFLITFSKICQKIFEIISNKNVFTIVIQILECYEFMKKLKCFKIYYLLENISKNMF